jgi:redox-sensitive bicupin YhaK (pirin superfamily)
MKVFRFEDLGKANYGWLDTTYHFSFANYYNPKRVSIGPLRVINNDYIAPHTGFDTHPHKDMEIITYIIDGELTHADSMGNEKTLGRHGIQYMSAGTGVFHSEHNKGDDTLHLFQTWIIPTEQNLEPNYGDKLFDEEDLKGAFKTLVSGTDDDGDIKIYQHASIKVGMFDQNDIIELPLTQYSTSYLIVIDGTIKIENQTLYKGDAIELDEDVSISVLENAHLYVVQV